MTVAIEGVTDTELFSLRELRGRHFTSYEDMIIAITQEAPRQFPQFRVPPEFNWGQYLQSMEEKGWIRSEIFKPPIIVGPTDFSLEEIADYLNQLGWPVKNVKSDSLVLIDGTYYPESLTIEFSGQTKES